MCRLTAAVAVCAAAALLPSLAAENRNWTGGGTQDANGYYMVSAGDNWGGTAPCANDNLFFTSPSEVSITNDTSLVYNAAPFNAGTYNFYGDLAVSSGNVRIPLADQNTSTLCKKNGNWTVASEFHVGYGSGSSGTFIHSGGTLTLSKKPIYIGSTAYASYTAKMTIDGGTVHASCPFSGNDRSVILGWNENGTGTAELTVSGTGRLVGANHIWLGRGTAGKLNIEGNGEVLLPNGSVFFFGGSLAADKFNGNQTSLLYLNGGVLTVQSIGYGANHVKARMGMYFNGGTLRAAMDNDDFIAIQNHDNSRGNVRVLAPGGTIDTNGHTINVRQLLDPPASGVSGDLVITGGGTYTQTGATAYNGRTIVDGNTKYVKNNDSSNLKLVVKTGSSFQNAAAVANRVAGASLTFEDGAKLVVEPTVNQISVSAPAIDVQGTLRVSSSPALPPEGVYTIMQITGGGTFAADILSRITFESAPAGLTIALSNDRKSISYTYYAHEWCWTGDGDGVTFGDPDNWHCKNVPGPTSDLYFSTAPAKTLQNDIDNLTVRSILFTGNCAPLTIAGKQIAMTGGGITNELDTVQTFTAPVAFPDDVAISAKQNICMNDAALKNEAGRIEFAGGVRGMHNSVNLDNRVFCGHWNFKAQTVTMNSDTAKRTTIYKNSSLEANTLEKTQAFYVMPGGAVTSAVINVTGLSLASYNFGEIVVTDTLSFPTSGSDLWTTSNGLLSTARVKARKLVLSGNHDVSLGTAASSVTASTCDWYLGEGGMNVNGASHFFMCHAGDVLRIHPWKCDTAINQASGSATAMTLQMKSGALEFHTDDEDGVARTISLDGIVSSVAGAVTSVKGTGTLALKNDQQLLGGVSVVGTATLEVAQSGMVALGGDLSLANGAALGFNFTNKRITPVLDLREKMVTAAGTVNVKISSRDGLHPRDGRHVLTSGGAFADVTVSLAEDAPKWVKGVSVADGEIVLDVIPRCFIVLVK